MPGRDNHPIGNHAACGDHGLLPDLTIILQYGVHADNGPPGDLAAVENRTMGHGDIFSDYGFAVRHNMDDSVVLDTASPADMDSTEVTPQHCSEPDAGAFFDDDITDQGCTGGDKDITGNLRSFTVIFQDNHLFRSFHHHNIILGLERDFLFEKEKTIFRPYSRSSNLSGWHLDAAVLTSWQEVYGIMMTIIVKGTVEMPGYKFRQILEQVHAGCLSVDQALEQMRSKPYEDLGFAKIDHHRFLQKGFPEVIYCPGKTVSQIVKIARQLAKAGAPVLATRAEPAVYDALRDEFPRAEYHREARLVMIRVEESVPLVGNIGVVTAGTADLPVAEEAALTAELMGGRVTRLYDVGVAGLHRLIDNLELLLQARVLVVVAGMEGALPSVVGGLASCPIIAVPTSVGYGAHFGGLASLLTMLNSCAPGVAVVNIDNGFGAGYIAALINRPDDQRGGAT